MSSFRRMESIRKLEQIRKESTGPISFSQKLILCCMGGGTIGLMCTFLIVAIGLVGLNIAKIVLGAIHQHNCPAQPLVPIYLIVGGVISVVINCTCRPNKGENGEVKLQCQGAGMVVGLIVGVFSLCWLITGTVLVVQTRNAVGSCTDMTTFTSAVTTLPPSVTTSQQSSSTLTTFTTDNSTQSSTESTTSVTTVTTVSPEVDGCPTCNDVLLTFAFAVVLLEWSFLVLMILIVCCVCGISCCVSKNNEQV